MIKTTIKGNVVSEFNKVFHVENRTILNKCITQLKDATPIDTGNAREGWRLANNQIVNNVPYIDSLNHGHSQQAPTHFIEKTLLGISGVHADGLVVRTR